MQDLIRDQDREPTAMPISTSSLAPTHTAATLVHPTYRADIDGLRAIAVLSVLAFHAFPKWVSGGFVGVDIFFVISGFLISSIIFRSLEDERFSFAVFYSRRIRRIFPALVVVLVASYVFGWFALLAEEYKQLGQHVAAGAGFVANLVLWSQAGYFDTAADTKPLLHLWSLGIEEQFYIVWPLTLWLGWKLRANLLLLTVGLLVGSFAVNLLLVTNHIVAAFYGPAARFWELSIGSALACTAMRRHAPCEAPRSGLEGLASRIACSWRRANNHAALRDLRSAAGCALVTVAVFVLSEESTFPGWLALLPTVGTYLVISAGPEAWLNRTVLSRRGMVFVGLISYPLYLWHWPLLSYLRIIGSVTPDRGVRIGTVFCSIVLAWLTYRFIERPMRGGRNSRVKVAVVCLLLLIIGCVGYATYRHEGFSFRLRAFEDQIRVIKTVVESSPACKAMIPIQSRYCLISDPTRPPTVVLIGDSHANRLFAALSAKYQRLGENLLQLGGGGCVPFWDVETGAVGEPNNCDRQMGPQLDYVLSSHSIKTVILLNRGPAHIEGTDLYSHGKGFIRDTRDPTNEDRRGIYREGLRKAVERFSGSGKKVIVVIDAPEFSYDPTRCIDLKRPLSSPFASRPDCRIARGEVDARNRGYVTITAAVIKRYALAKMVNLQDALCDAGSCYGIREGRLLYRDADHLNEFGGEYVVRRLWDRF